MIMNFASNLWDFMVGAFIIFLFIMWIWLLISVFSDLFRRKDSSGLAKVIWVIVLLVLPYLGVFAYLLTLSLIHICSGPCMCRISPARGPGRTGLRY